MDPLIFKGGPWIHMALIGRSRPNQLPIYYLVFRHINNPQTYIEIITEQNSFEKIKDDKEWADVYRFAKENGIFNVGLNETFNLNV